MVLVPDLATDLGTPNEDFTEWTFTIREGVKYENGQEVTAEDIAYGIKRSFDRETFPEGAAYSNDYFLDGDTYKGPYKTGEDYKGVVGRRHGHHHQDGQRRSRTCRTGVRSRPWARSPRARTATRPSTRCTRGRPVRTCSTSTRRRSR